MSSKRCAVTRPLLEKMVDVGCGDRAKISRHDGPLGRRMPVEDDSAATITILENRCGNLCKFCEAMSQKLCVLTPAARRRNTFAREPRGIVGSEEHRDPRNVFWSAEPTERGQINDLFLKLAAKNANRGQAL
jgi:hypothetical protein